MSVLNEWCWDISVNSQEYNKSLEMYAVTIKLSQIDMTWISPWLIVTLQSVGEIRRVVMKSGHLYIFTCMKHLKV